MLIVFLLSTLFPDFNNLPPLLRPDGSACSDRTVSASAQDETPERLALASRQREALMGSEQRRTLILLGVVLEMNWTGDQISLLLSQNLKPRLSSRRRHTGATCR